MGFKLLIFKLQVKAFLLFLADIILKLRDERLNSFLLIRFFELFKDKTVNIALGELAFNLIQRLFGVFIKLDEVAFF